MTQKKFQDLNLADAYLFAAALNDPETCRITLEILLGKEIDSVTVHAEYSMLFSSDYRSIRLDIYSMDAEGRNYNVEMQGENEGNLPKRSRYHQAEMDVLSLEPGEDFNNLHHNYVIFICRFDPFGKGLYRYTFTNHCEEIDMALNDGTTKVFLSTKGKNSEAVSPELVYFLEYVEDSTEARALAQESNAVKQIHERVTAVKKSREWERKYMTFEELLRKEYKQGHKEGQQRLLALTTKMVEAGEADKIPLLSDADFRAEMYQKYNL